MVVIMRVNSNIMRYVEKVNIVGLMVNSILASGIKIRCMVKVY